MTAFDDALKLTLGYEGGVSNDPADRGKLTNHGVTQGTYARWRRANKQPSQSVVFITAAEVRAIYHDLFWLPAHCDQLSHDLALCVFDASINHGPARAIMILQNAVGAEEDGRFGPMTRKAVAAMSEEQTIRNYLASRADFYAEIISGDPTQARFRRGWANRIAMLRQELLNNEETRNV